MCIYISCKKLHNNSGSWVFHLLWILNKRPPKEPTKSVVLPQKTKQLHAPCVATFTTATKLWHIMLWVHCLSGRYNECKGVLQLTDDIFRTKLTVLLINLRSNLNECEYSNNTDKDFILYHFESGLSGATGREATWNVQFISLYREFWYSHSSFTNRCTFIRILIKIYIKIRWLLHVSVYDHHQGACNWAWLKLYWY